MPIEIEETTEVRAELEEGYDGSYDDDGSDDDGGAFEFRRNGVDKEDEDGGMGFQIG